VQVKVGERLYEVRSQADLEALCAELKSALEARCIYNSWYIRVPPDRLLEIAEEAYLSYLRGRPRWGPWSADTSRGWASAGAWRGP
jgi:hypothetical protein